MAIHDKPYPSFPDGRDERDLSWWQDQIELMRAGVGPYFPSYRRDGTGTDIPRNAREVLRRYREWRPCAAEWKYLQDGAVRTVGDDWDDAGIEPALIELAGNGPI